MEDDEPRRAPATGEVIETFVPNADHQNPFGVDWRQLGWEDVERFLAGWFDDEPLHWEAKSGEVTTKHVAVAATGFANSEGGYLIVGVERNSDGSWRLEGVEVPGREEPRVWLSKAIRSSVTPNPTYRTHTWQLPNGKTAAVVQVQPNTGLLSMSYDRIYHRRDGETVPIGDGATLHTLGAHVLARTRGPGEMDPVASRDRPATTPPGDGDEPGTGAREGYIPPATRPTTPGERAAADDLRALAQQLATSGSAPVINIYISSALSEVQAAIAGGEDERLGAALDRLTEIAGVAISYAPEGDASAAAINALHQAFDYGVNDRGSPSTIPRDQLWLQLLQRARAVGALAVRLGHWGAARRLIQHEVDAEGPRLWPSWFRHGDIMVTRAHLYRRENNVLEGHRAPLRLAVEQTVRLPALRPDGTTDEDVLVTSACQFDFILNVVATWDARDARPIEAALPYYAAWDGERVRPVATRLVSDDSLRTLLMPEATEADLANMLRWLSDRAHKGSEGLGSWVFWDGFISGKVAAFLEKHPQP